MKKTHFAGLILWRAGLLLAFGYVVLERLRRLLSIADAQLEIALAVGLTGLLFVFLSVVWERVNEVREERRQQ